PPVPLGHRQRLHRAPGVFVARPDRSDFAFPNEFVERAERIFVTRVVIGPVRLIQVDVIGLQPPETPFDRPADVVPVDSRLALPDRRYKPSVPGATELRGDDQAIARLSRQPAANDLLRALHGA